jgi:hypothetical protein
MKTTLWDEHRCATASRATTLRRRVVTTAWSRRAAPGEQASPRPLPSSGWATTGQIVVRFYSSFFLFSNFFGSKFLENSLNFNNS